MIWSCSSVVEGRKEASGLMFNRDRVLRYEDWYRQATRVWELCQLYLAGVLTRRTAPDGENEFILGSSFGLSTCKRTHWYGMRDAPSYEILGAIRLVQTCTGSNQDPNSLGNKIIVAGEIV